MPTLTEEQRTAFTRSLKQRYRELWNEVQGELDNAPAFAEIVGEARDLEDEATSDVLVDVNLAAIHRNIQEMRDIESSLGRIIERSYGVCTDCGDDIAPERLNAWPTAKRCQPCQNRYERQHMPAKGPSL
ncbi:MAG: TraR/DksA family transcriptional regulator [Nevskia sp.]|nr:TraR/DksA family transcriptional regulator [Nevskia sp.]